MLCALCITTLRSGCDGQHHKTFSDLQNAAKSGCKICWEVEQRVRVIMKKFATPDSPPSKINCQFAWEYSDRSQQMVFKFDELDYGVYFTLSALKDKKAGDDIHEVISKAKQDIEIDPSKVRDHGKKPEFATSTGDPAVIEMAKKWLTSCQKDHKGCGIINPNFYPKRLLDLSHDVPSLIETRHHKLRDHYATLSHCWGRNEFFTLTKNNLDDLIVGIPLEKLPKSFQNAITICKRLEIPYLWIDSLCIIQSNEKVNEDWLEHARTMSDIYKNCLLNIAIDRASNPFEGAFAERPPGALGSCFALVGRRRRDRDMRPKLGDWRTWKCCKNWLNLSVEKNPVYCQISGECDWIDSVGEMPLSSRAWVFQERFLSPRALHFGTDRIFWECRSITRSEGSVAKDQKINESSIFETSEKGMITHKSRRFPYFQYECLRNEWLILVGNYNSRILTMPEKDKLIAFAAVAQEVEKRREDEYVAGLFKGDLPYDLIWTPSLHKTLECPRPAKYQAPSWSWACLNAGAFSTRSDWKWSHPEGAISEILGINIKYVDEKNRYGMVESGTLHIKGRIAPCTWNKNEVRHDDGRGTDWITARVPGIPPTQPPGTEFEGPNIEILPDVEEDKVFSGRECALFLITPDEGLLLVGTGPKDVYRKIGLGFLRQGCTLERYAEAFQERTIEII
ncbi:heterokaryon incompatibility protein-domain-containing protein [Phyllosticta citribraziliensis]|uniref:Heterokaryon incompatibility protein-domain-containing protein n=1 Tax=Phyllosticta citribraziliensis TaxID=989973 RepID=A0ABR1L430_9PEZI